jgi:uncharacterized damage-inducible protein DinB
MENNKQLNFLNLSRIDVLTVRKMQIETIIESCKKQLEDKILMLFAGGLDDNIELKTKGQVVFYEKWIKEINDEIDELQIQEEKKKSTEQKELEAKFLKYKDEIIQFINKLDADQNDGGSDNE